MGKATEKQIDFATAIAEELCLDYPDFDDREDTSEFISEYADEFYEQRNSRRYRSGNLCTLEHSYVGSYDFNGDLNKNPKSI